MIRTITRCAATEVKSGAAERASTSSRALQDDFGRNLIGVDAEVMTGGTLARRRIATGLTLGLAVAT